ncbi:MAG: acyl-CoA dehydrogenase family protein, partial [Myxococcales bacterium]|nr:acyl-CoA dehydrogenase family protein [Myxococcales bacterium]
SGWQNLSLPEDRTFIASVPSVATALSSRARQASWSPVLDHDSQGGDSANHDDFADQQPVLASCYRAATTGRQLLGQDPGQPVLSGRHLPDQPHKRTIPLPRPGADVQVRPQRAVLPAVGLAHGAACSEELQKRLTSRCLQLFGGYGFMDEYPISADYADAAVQTIYGGTSEIMKLIIARPLGLDDK